MKKFKEELKEILIGVELYGKCPTGNWGMPVEEATEAIIKAVREIVPKEENEASATSEIQYNYFIGVNQIREEILKRLED